MRSLFRVLAVLLFLLSPVLFAGCGGTGAAVPAAGSPSSEAADAAGGVNKSDLPSAGTSTETPAAGEAEKGDASKKDAEPAPAEGEKKDK
jgi:hypothetical protein